MIDFPSNPTDGQQFTSGNSSWVWNAAASQWRTALTANAILDNTVTAAKLTSAAIPDKLGYTPVSPTDLNSGLSLKANTSALGSLAYLNSIADYSITDAKFTTSLAQRLGSPFVKKQVVHRRPLYGIGTLSIVAGDVYRNDSTCISTPYGPFSYGLPTVQSGAERRFRLYAVYSDGSQSQGSPQILIRPNDSATNQVVFTLDSTWGGTGSANRDCYSNEIVGVPWTDHGYVRVSGTGTVNYAMRFHYIELQALDVWL